MTFLLCPDENQIDKVAVLAKKLTTFGFRCIIDSDFKDRVVSADISFLCAEECDAKADVIVSIGGDGTMLKTAQRALSSNKPIFGLNAGRIGFLCAFDFEEIDSLQTEDIVQLRLSERMLLEVRIDGDDEVYYAVNDAVVNKGGISRTIELEVRAGKSLIGDYRADGVIVSTPTGSTGYSLSAGGPIIEPHLDIVLVTPICAHAMFSRGIALSGDEDIRIQSTGRTDNNVYLSVDSSYTFLLKDDFGVSIKKSKKMLKLLTSDKRDYYEMINRRISVR